MTVFDSGRSSRELTIKLRDNHVPVGMRRTVNGTYLATLFEDSQLLLIDRLDYVMAKGTYVYDFFGCSVVCEFIPGTAATYVYYVVDQDINPLSMEILGALSRHFTGDFNFYYNEPASYANLWLGMETGRLSKPEIDVAWLESLPKPKISGSHHIHFTALEVWSSLTRAEQDRACYAAHAPPDATTSFVAGLMLWLSQLDSDIFDDVISSDLLRTSTVREFASYGKKISVKAKSLQNIVPKDLRQVFEIDVLVNRDVGQVDWAAEKEHRTKPVLANVSYRDVYGIAKSIFQKVNVQRQKPRSMSWSQFWDTRWQWSAAGSIHSQYSDDMKYVSSQRELRNKFIALSTMPDRKFSYFAERKPNVVAWSSVKYEWGKMRAIYGTDLTSYVLSHFAFYNCEDMLPDDFPVGMKARSSFVSSRVASVLHKAIPFCLDYEDFNSQHSNEAMEAVVDAYIDVIGKFLSDEQVLAAKWTRDSIRNTTVIDNMGTKTTYRSNGTLMSGWRLTTFVNSVLNYVYTMKIAGSNTAALRSVHNGDDVLIGVRNVSVCTTMFRAAKKMGVRLQHAKCAFGGLAEFLRVDHARGESGQYLSRNVATVMHSRIESKIATDVRDLLTSMSERLSEFITRGGRHCTAMSLWNMYLSRTAELTNHSKEDLNDMVRCHLVVGGSNQDPKAPVDKYISVEREHQLVDMPKTLPGAQAYARVLTRSLRIPVSVATVTDRVMSATLKAVQLSRTTVKVAPNRAVQKYIVLRALHGAYRDMKTDALLGKARLVGFVIDALAQSDKHHGLATMMVAANDPLEYLTVVV